jgi:predicted CXXCH cytochrome family protein
MQFYHRIENFADMKKLIFLLVFAAASAYSFGQSIVGTPHDFSSATFNGSAWANDACFVCHQSHNNVNAPADLLWNQTISTEAFTMYSNPATLDGTVDPAPSGVSLLCLSCHDDATALGNSATALSAHYPTTTADVGVDLTNDHPIGIVYDHTVDLALTDPAGHANVQLFNDGTNDKVECASCHNAHDNTNTYFLRVANNNSDLCLECHVK